MYLQYVLPVCKHKTMTGMSMYVFAVCPLSVQAQNNGGDVHVCTYSISSQCASTKQWQGCPCMYLQYVLSVCKHKTMAGMSMYVLTVYPPSVQAQNNGRNVMYVLPVCPLSMQAQNNGGDVHVCTYSISSQCASTKQWRGCPCMYLQYVLPVCKHKTMAGMSMYVFTVCPPSVQAQNNGRNVHVCTCSMSSQCASTKQWRGCPCMYLQYVLPVCKHKTMTGMSMYVFAVCPLSVQAQNNGGDVHVCTYSISSQCASTKQWQGCPCMYLQYVLSVCKHKTMAGMSMYVLTVYPPSVQAQNNGRNVMYVLPVCPLSMQAQNNGGDVHVCTYSISSQCASTKQWRGCPCMYLQYVLPVCKHKTMAGMSMYVFTVCPPSVQAQNNGRNVHVCTCSMSSQCASTKQWRGCPCMYLQYVLPVCKHKTMAGKSVIIVPQWNIVTH